MRGITFAIGVLILSLTAQSQELLRPAAPQTQPSTDDAKLLAGVIDIHCHVAPDVVARSMNDFDLVRLARKDGMRAIVLKNHYFLTADRAQLAMKELGGIEVFGGVVLNRSMGGLNLEVVERMLQIDGHRGKIVWLPTFDAENQVRFSKEDRPFVSVVKDGKPVSELLPIFDLIAKNDLALATGHSAAAESLITVAAAKQAGVRKIVITHAVADPVSATDAQLQQFAAMGAFIECTWMHVFTHAKASGIATAAETHLLTGTDYARVIRLIGAEHVIISSDLGQQANPLHPDGMLSFIKALKAEGITDEQIDLVARKNAARLLGLDPW